VRHGTADDDAQPSRDELGDKRFLTELAPNTGANKKGARVAPAKRNQNMTDKAPVRVDRLDIEEREEQLKEFIRSAMARDAGASRPLVLLAKSPEVMVARAVFALSAELAAAGVTAEIIFAAGSSAMAGESWDLTFDPAFEHETRLLRDPRYLDGHEQLVCGAGHVWFGDCMRRDADKRDAFCKFIRDDAEMAARGRRTFAALWSAAEQIYRHVNVTPRRLTEPGTQSDGRAILMAAETPAICRPSVQN
jgi:hypothetical protein